MKVTLNIVAAVLIAAGLVVAVASLLTPGQVILGIDFKLAATLVVGGLILQALANALTLLERMSSDLRQLRKAGSEEPPWLRQVTGQSAAVLATGAEPSFAAAERGDQGPEATADPFALPAALAADDAWPPETGDQWPEPVAPDASDVAAAAPRAEAAIGPSDPWIERDFEPQGQTEMEPAEGILPEQPVPSSDTDARQAGIDEEAGGPAEPEPRGVEARDAPAIIAAEAAEAEPDRPLVPEAADVDAVGAELDLPVTPEPAEVEPDSELAARPDVDTDRHARFTSKLKPSRDRAGGRVEVAPEPEMPAPPPEDTAEEPPALYVVEERMFRGKQSRVLSDGTIEAETAEGWMRFEDFDHLEEYLDAMADLGR